MPESLAHLTDSAIEQLADDLLAGPERVKADAHVEHCCLCAGKLEASRALIEALSALPRFAPSVDFADQVIARIQVAPRASPVFAWVRHWTPESRRGWMLLIAALLAPMLPLLGVVVWVASSPVLTLGAVADWAWGRTQSLVAGSGATVARWGAELGVAGWFEGVYALAERIPIDALIVALIILAVAIPLSAWSLVRLVRTPTGNVTYAN